MTQSWLLVALLAQSAPTGYVSVFLDRLPNRDATELRVRVFAEDSIDAGPRVRIKLAGFAEGLLADRTGRVTDARAEPQELTLDVRSTRVDVTVGLGRVVWGRLDEVQPTDVVNPLDVSRFFFDGRSEARLAVPLARAVVHFGGTASIDAVYVPVFRRGRFDRLAEGSSPFTLAPVVPFTDRRPSRTFSSGQGGARVNVTSGRVDWSVSAYRGFRPFGVYSFRLKADATEILMEKVYPRFTMVGGDFETVAGAWVVRGEVAAFTEDDGRSFDAGGGVDRKAGDYRISGQVLVHREDDAGSRTDVSFILAADRSFARQKYRGRLFGVYNPKNESGFVRGIATASLRDNVALEGSIGWFAGNGLDSISRFSDSDFLYVRLKYFF